MSSDRIVMLIEQVFIYILLLREEITWKIACLNADNFQDSPAIPRIQQQGLQRVLSLQVFTNANQRIPGENFGATAIILWSRVHQWDGRQK
jgi:hypothetical protein